MANALRSGRTRRCGFRQSCWEGERFQGFLNPGSDNPETPKWNTKARVLYGLAQVISPAVQASEFKTSIDGKTTLLSDLPVEATSMFEKTEPEYLVAVRW